MQRKLNLKVPSIEQNINDSTDGGGAARPQRSASMTNVGRRGSTEAPCGYVLRLSDATK